MLVKTLKQTKELVQSKTPFWCKREVAELLPLHPSSTIRNYTYITWDVYGRICVGAVTDSYHKSMKD